MQSKQAGDRWTFLQRGLEQYSRLAKSVKKIFSKSTTH